MKNRLFNLKTLIGTNLVTLVLTSLITTTIVFAAFTTYDIRLDALPGPYTYIVEYDGVSTYRAIKYTGQTFYDNTNASVTINSCIASITAGTIFLRASLATPATLKLVAHPNIIITGEIGFENAGAITGYNGTWIAHGLAGDPETTGSITLSLRGVTGYNATMILRVPTVISSNATHFQIEFRMWETVGWTLVPVTAVEAQIVYWHAVFKL